MKKSLVVLTVLGCAVLGIFGCVFSKGWKMDYGMPVAQFEEKDVLAKGKEFVGKKVTVRGVVERVDVGEEGKAKVYLSTGIECEFGKMKAMAESCRKGEVVYVDGFLEKCEEGKVVIDPAMLRDPKAKFEPR